MTTHREPIRAQFPSPSSHLQPRPLRVDPFAPLPTSSPFSHPAGESAAWPEEVLMNSVPTAFPATRTTSGKRRLSGTGSGNRKSQVEYRSQPPAAPEVPRAPPALYRDSYTNIGTSPPIGNPTSFAARARGFAEDQEMIPADVSPRQSRRRSVNGPSKTVKSEQSDGRQGPESSQPPIAPDGVRIQQSTSAKVPRQRQVTDPQNPQLGTSLPTSAPHANSAAVPARSSTRRSSAGAADPRKEWAPDRSPLQKLEVKLNDISKEEKRARVEKAEKKMRERQAEKERREQGQGLDPDANLRQVREAAGSNNSETKPVLSKRVPEPNIRPVAPTYVEDIDEQQLERQQLPPRKKTAPVAVSSMVQSQTQRSRKTASDDVVAQQQTGRGVRFRSGNSSEENDNNIAPRDREGQLRSQNRPISDLQNSRPQQKIHQRELIKDATNAKEVPSQEQTLYSSKTQSSGETDDPAAYGGAPDPVRGSSVRAQNRAFKYEIPPQTAAGIEARQKVGFGGDPAGALPAPAQRHKHHLSRVLHHTHADVPPQIPNFETQPRHLDEWRQGGTARLTAADFVTGPEVPSGQKAWWEGGKPRGQGKIGLNGSYSDEYGM